jgi:hypothetical protein
MVGIYIYIDELIDGVLTPISKRIELFADETISVTSSIQNFNDLGKIFTDYSKSFTVPASAVNNKIFSYWYENAVSDGFDQRKKYFGRIEIDDIPFRFGKFQLEKADKKDNMVESYTINFTGNLTQLKDRFKDDKLNSLRDANGVSYYNELNFDYDLINMGNALQLGTLNPYVAFPLIGSNRRYECGTGSSSDITTTGGKINTRDLFPAIPVWKIFEYIQSAYGITFSGVFLDSLLFKNLWLYLKNTEKFTPTSELIQLDFATTFTFQNPTIGYIDLVTNEYIFTFNNLTTVQGTTRIESFAKLNVASIYNALPFNFEIYDNGVLYRRYENLYGLQDINFFSKTISQENPVNGQFQTHRFTFFISSNFDITLDLIIEHKRRTNLGQAAAQFAATFGLTTSSFLNIQNYVPDITVESFLIGILKAHNLMIIPLNETSFEFIPMDAYFQRGTYLDITEYCSTESEQISKPRIFKTIKFAFEKSENIINNAFRGFFNREYGDLDFTNENISSTEVYDVKLPFEDIMYERYIPPITTGSIITNFVTATLWNKDQQPYTPKPVLMYDNGFINLDLDGTSPTIKYSFDSFDFTSNPYRRFTNELEIGGTDASLLYAFNFSDEVGVVNSDIAPPKGLYDTYYANYVENLYNIRTRKVTVKAMLNTLIVNTIQLYDRIIYKNKRYTINTMTVDLTTKETTFELLSDFRQFSDSNLGLRNTNIDNLTLNNTAQEVQVQVFLNDSQFWNAKASFGFLAGSYFQDDTFQDGLLIVSVPANATALDRSGNIIIEFTRDGVDRSIQIPVLQNA